MVGLWRGYDKLVAVSRRRGAKLRSILALALRNQTRVHSHKADTKSSPNSFHFPWKDGKRCRQVVQDVKRQTQALYCKLGNVASQKLQ